MSEMKSHLEIAIASVKCFANDGTLDHKELDMLLGLALRDDHVDEEERRVLGNIFNRVSKETVSSSVWDKIQEVKTKYQID